MVRANAANAGNPLPSRAPQACGYKERRARPLLRKEAGSHEPANPGGTTSPLRPGNEGGFFIEEQDD